MIKTLRQIINMKAALWVNAFCYYFKRLWLVGKWMSETIYSKYEVKRTLCIAAVVIRQIIDFLGKPIYLLICVGLPLIFIVNAHPGMKDSAFAAAVQIIFFLNGIIGSFGDSQIFSVTREKVTCIKYLHMNPRSFLQGALAFKYIPFFLYYLPWLLVLSHLSGGTVLQGIFLWLMLFSLRMMGEAFHLLVFDRAGKVLSRNMAFEWLTIGIGLAGAYASLGFGWILPISAVLLHPICVALCTLLGGFCLWYITSGYRGYEKKYHRSVDINFLFSSLMKASSGSAAGFKEVEIRERDNLVSDAQISRLRHLHGYAYLNALFFARHRRQLVKPVCYRLLCAALLFAGSVVLWLSNRQTAVRLSQDLTVILPFFVYVMYFMTVADKASRAMFYNCDKDMLRYAYYRRPQTILRNFQIRLIRVSLYNLSIAAGVCLAAIGFCLLCKTSILSPGLLLFCAAVLLLSVLFTAHHLCLYYLFQPYSENLKVKNPFYSVINYVMYLLCFLCLNIDVGGPLFTAVVLAFTILYIIAALALVYRFAPKSFRIK